MSEPRLGTKASVDFYAGLSEKYGKRKLAKMLELDYSQLWKVCIGRIFPSKNVIAKTAECLRTTPEAISKLITVMDSIKPQYPHIRDCVYKNALFFEQAQRILSSSNITPEEEDIISYFYLVQKGDRMIHKQNRFVLIPKEKRTSAVTACESMENLNSEFSETLGFWFKIRDSFFFQAVGNDTGGIRFVSDFQTLVQESRLESRRKTFIQTFGGFIDSLQSASINAETLSSMFPDLSTTA